jgi:ribosomal protein S18 acetylase RimI-like enzyme
VTAAIVQGGALGGRERASFMSVYEASFPPEQREEVGALLLSIAKGERCCRLALMDGSVIGFAVSLPLRGQGIQYLEYLAVDSAFRGQGIGGALLERHVAPASGGALAPARGSFLRLGRRQDRSPGEAVPLPRGGPHLLSSISC